MPYTAAEQFLKSYYQDDVLDSDTIRSDDERFERILGDATRFPNADLDFICKFSDAAAEWLAGQSA